MCCRKAERAICPTDSSSPGNAAVGRLPSGVSGPNHMYTKTLNLVCVCHLTGAARKAVHTVRPHITQREASSALEAMAMPLLGDKDTPKVIVQRTQARVGR